MSERLNINEWSATSRIEDPIERKKKYIDYLRDTYVEDETLNDNIEETLRSELVTSFRNDGFSGEEIAEFVKPEPQSFEKKSEIVTRSGLLNGLEEADPIRQYNAFQKIKESGEATEEYLAQEEELFSAAFDVVDKNYNKAVEKLVGDGVVPFGITEGPDGTRRLRGGDAVDGMSFYEAFQKSRDFGLVSSEDALELKKSTGLVEGKTAPLWRYQNYQEAFLGLRNASGDGYFDDALNRYTKSFSDVGNYDADSLKVDVVRELERVIPDTEFIPLADKLAAIEYVAGQTAMSSGLIKFDSDDLSNNIRTFGYGDTAIHQNLFAKRDIFEQAIAGRSDKEKERFKNERDLSLQALYPSYTKTLNNTYLSSDWNDALTQGLAEGRKQHEILDDFLAITDYSEFKNEFVGTILRSIPDAVVDTVAGVGTLAGNDFSRDVLLANHEDRQARAQLAEMFGDKQGVVTTLGSMTAPVIFDIGATALLTATTGVGGAAYVGLKTGARVTTKGLVSGILAGGLRQKGTETIEQAANRLVTKRLIADFGDPKKNLQTAIKGIRKDQKDLIAATEKRLGRTLTSAERKNIVDQGDAAVSKLQKLAAPSALKKQSLASVDDAKSTLEATRKISAYKVIESYNKVVANKVAQGSAIFIPAATRSGSMTYASVYSALPNDMDEKDRHQKALYAGLAAGAVTGSLVLGFRAVGLGGVEDFMVGKATVGNVKSYLRNLSERLVTTGVVAEGGKVLSKDVLDLAIAKIAARGLPNSAKLLAQEGFRKAMPLVRGGVGEALEEGTDEFINSFIQTEFTGDDMLFSDRVKHAGMAAFYGGVFGVALPPLMRRTFGRGVRGQRAFDQQVLAQEEAVKRISDDLIASGSPQSAAAIEERLDQIKKRAAQGKAGDPAPAADTPAPQTEPAAEPTKEATPPREGPATPAGMDRQFELPLGDERSPQQLELPLDEGVAPQVRGDLLKELAELQARLETDPDEETRARIQEIRRQLETSEEQGEFNFSETPLFEQGRGRSDIETLADQLAQAFFNASVEEHRAAYRAAIKEGGPVALDEAGNFVGTSGASSAFANQLISQVSEVDGKAAKNLNFALLTGLISEEDLALIQVDANARGLDTNAVVNEVNDFLAIKMVSLVGPPQARELGDFQADLLSVVTQFLGRGEAEATPSNVKEFLRSEQGKKASFLTEEDAFLDSIEFVRKALGLSKREEAQAKKGLFEAQRDIFQEDLEQIVVERVEDLIKRGVRVRITRDNLYGIPDIAFKPSPFKTPLGEGNVPKQFKMGLLTAYINEQIENNFPIRTGADLVKGLPSDVTLETYRSRRSNIAYRADSENHVGAFNNDPFSMADMMRKFDGILIKVPTDEGGINPAFVFAEDGVTVVDVQGPHPTKENVTISLVRDAVIPQAVSKFFEKQTELNEGLNPNEGAKLKLQVTLGDPSKSETFTLFDSSADGEPEGYTIDDALKILSDRYEQGYEMVTEETSETSAGTETLAAEQGKNFAAVVTAIMRSGESTLRGKTFDTLRSTAMSEVFTVFEKFLKTQAILNTLLTSKVVAFEGGEYKVQKGKEAELFKYVKTPTENIAKRLVKGRGKDLPFNTDNEKKAVFIRQNGFLGQGEAAPKITTTARGSKLASDWEGKTLKAFFEKEFNNPIYNRQAGLLDRSGSYPDFFAIISAATNRASSRAAAVAEVGASLKAQTVSLDAPGGGVSIESPSDLNSNTVEETLDNIDGAIDGIINDFNLTKATEGERNTLAAGLRRAFVAASEERRRASAEQDASVLGPEKLLEVLARTYMGRSAAVKGSIDTVLNSLEVPATLTDFFAKLRATLDKTYISYTAPSFIFEKETEFYRQENQEVISRLGLESGNAESVVAAIREIAANSSSSLEREAARILLSNPDALSGTQFVIYDIPDGRAGFYDRSSNAVYVNLGGYNGSGLQSVLLHEYLHASTVDLLTRDNLTPKQARAKAQLIKLFNSLKGLKGDSRQGIREIKEFDFALSSLEEFVATFFSSSSFQNTLKTLRSDRKNVFQKVLDFFLNLFPARANAETRKAFRSLSDLVGLQQTNIALDPMGNAPSSLVGTLETVSRRFRATHEVEPSLRHFTDRPTESVQDPAPPQESLLFSSFEAMSETAAVTPQQEKTVRDLADQAIANINPAISVSVVEKTSEAARIFEGRPNASAVAVLLTDDSGETFPAIFVARQNLVNAVLAREGLLEDELNVKGALEAVFAEEETHILEYRAIPQQEKDAYIASLSDIDFDEAIDEYTSDPELNARLKAGIAAGDAEIKDQMAGEIIRMQFQRIVRGTRTEEDIAFYESNPSLLRILLRYLARGFRRMYAKYNLKKNNPELSRMLNRMGRELKFISNGGAGYATRLPFDPRDPDAGYRVLARRFEATAREIDMDSSVEDVMARFKGLFDTLELPVLTFKNGKYSAYTYEKAAPTLAKAGQVAGALLVGDVDPRPLELEKRRQSFAAAVEKIGNSKLSAFERIRKQYPEVSDALISEASGSSADAFVDADFRRARRDLYGDWKRETEARVLAGELDPSAIKKPNRLKKYKELVTTAIEQEESKLKTEIETRISNARNLIKQSAEPLARAIQDIRAFVDALSNVMAETYGLKDSLKLKVDSQMGIYITRTYKLFTEEGYLDKILSDPNTEVYKNAYAYFEEMYVSTKARSLRRKSRKEGSEISYEEAKRAATLELESSKAQGDPVADAMEKYLYMLHSKTTGDYAKPAQGVTSALLSNLKERRNVPPVIQDLLGRYGDEEGIQNIFRTMGVVTQMIARQNYYNNLIELGSNPENGFVLTHAQVQQKIAEGDNSYRTWINLRKGTQFTQDAEPEPDSQLASDYDKTFNYYVPPEMAKGMRKMFSPSVSKDQTSTAEDGVSTMATALNFITGASLSAKTLGSAGFYLRNIVGNILYFAPAQGFGVPSLLKIMSRLPHVVKGFTNPDAFDAYYAELRSLNIIGGDIYASQIRELFTSKHVIRDTQKELSALTKLARKTGKAIDQTVLKRLERLSQQVDAFYKIAYFELEVENLKKAREWSRENNPTDESDIYLNMSDYEIKDMASKKVRKTAQSYADSLHLVEVAGKKFGSFLTPFLRFKTEVLRITVNTYKLAAEEIKSNNAVIRIRGLKRMAGINFVLLGMGMGIPTVLRTMLGIREDEDEFLRAAGPIYKKTNTFIYTKGFTPNTKDTIYSWDLTFLNPFAVETDPALRLLEHISRGEPLMGLKAAITNLTDTYLDEQIFLGAALDVRRNKRSDTGAPIYEDADGLTGYAKSIAYIFEEAYSPRTVATVIKAIKAKSFGDLPPDPSKSPETSLALELAPVKPWKVDAKLSFRRFLEKKRDERNRATSSLNLLKSTSSLTEGQIRRAVRKWVKTRKRVDEEIYRALYAANRIGLSPQEAKNIMSLRSLGMGQRRQQNIVFGEMDRPVFTKPFVDSVMGITPDGQVGLQRLRIGQEEIEKFGPSTLVLDIPDQ